MQISPRFLILFGSLAIFTSQLVHLSCAHHHESHLHQTQIKLSFEGNQQKANVFAHDKAVVCYVGTWSTYRKAADGSIEGAFNWEDIDATLCTHLIYSFAGLDNQTFVMKPLDEFLDLEINYGRAWYQKFNNLKKSHPHLKVLLAVGGWNEGSRKYSDMASDANNRKAFIDSALDLIRKYGFDGLDLDWEFPGSRGGRPEDKKHFTQLVKELRLRFDEYNLKLTAAFSAVKSIIQVSYDIKELSDHLDQLHIMCYDYHGSWDKVTGHNTPLYTKPGLDEFSVESSIDHFISMGANPEKMVLGVAAYGRTFLLANETDITLKNCENDNGCLGKVAENKGFKGPFTKEDGFLGYNEICKELVSDRGDWEIYVDRVAMVPFMRSLAKFVSFDNPDSLREKIWSIDTDDFNGHCGNGVKYPLLKSINNALTEYVIPSTKTSTYPPEIDDNTIDSGSGATADAGPITSPTTTRSFILAIFITILCLNLYN